MRIDSAGVALILATVLWSASAAARSADTDTPVTGASAQTCAIPADVWEEHQTGYCALPADVRAFVAKNDLCEHFLGEEAYDAARRRELEKAFKKYCKGARNKFDALLARHRNDSTTSAWLQRYGEEMTLP